MGKVTTGTDRDRSMPEPLLALIFDVDGTLADTEEAHRIAFNQTFHAAGLDWHWDPDLYTQLLAVAGGKERILHYINVYQAAFSKGFSPDELNSQVAALHRDKTQRYQEMLRRGEVPVRSGVKRLLKQAHDCGLKLGIATTTSMTNVDALLQNAFAEEVRGWIDMIAAGEMVAHKKPAADIYQCALHGLGLRSENCIAFEDSLIGLQSASGAGLKTIITTDRYSRHRHFDGALIVLDKLGETDDPIEVISGDPMGHSYVDLAMIRELHAMAYSETGSETGK